MLALQNGFPLSTLVKGIYMNGVMEGKHSIDIGLLIAPVLHEIILSAAKTYGVAVKELPKSPSEEVKERDAQRIQTSIERGLETGLSEDESLEESMVSREEEPVRVLEEEAEEGEMVEENKKESKGLMSRRV